MEAQEFEEVNVRIAEDQPEYETLPAHWNREEGSLTFCFKLDENELNRIKATGEIWIKQLTFGGAMNPIALSTNKEILIKKG